jgi:hypothetical protein
MKKSNLGSFLNDIIEEFPSDLSSKNAYKKQKNQAKKKRPNVEKSKKRSTNKTTSFQRNDNRNTQQQKDKKPKVTYVEKLDIEDKNKKDPRKINLTRDEMRKAIIYSEILGKPKSLR